MNAEEENVERRSVGLQKSHRLLVFGKRRPAPPRSQNYLKYLLMNLVILVDGIFHHSFAERTSILFCGALGLTCHRY